MGAARMLRGTRGDALREALRRARRAPRRIIQDNPLLLPEDAYGRAKRQQFVESVIHAGKPATVLDFGCGTGTQLTWPLAETFPQVSFLGVDSDAGTIAWARRQ